MVTFTSAQCHAGQTYHFSFGTLALRAERQSAEMSEMKSGRLDLHGQVLQVDTSAL